MPRSRRRHDYTPRQDILDRFPDISGNTVNGLGETEQRRPSCFFWHPPERQTHGALQKYIVSAFRPDSMEDRSFRNPNVDRGPALQPQAAERQPGDAAQWTPAIKSYVLEDEADLVGITDLKPDYVYDGESVAEPRLILIGVAHDYARLSQAPGCEDNPEPYYDLHDQYNRAARVAARLTNHIRSLGYATTAFSGPMAGALNMIPAAIEAGLGQLGKHGSLINRTYGSGFRLSAVATDLPLTSDRPDTTTSASAVRSAAIPARQARSRTRNKWFAAQGNGTSILTNASPISANISPAGFASPYAPLHGLGWRTVS
ncbi:MAG: reductive dehalogenase domain-containing protein [Alphaproteobacteria bacterium]|jgi:hypothetical protein|nr:reductive dehalogenase domain-containing protein [Alphaproteobacteria bacterium]